MSFDIEGFHQHKKKSQANESPMVSIRGDGKMYLNRSASDLVGTGHTHAVILTKSSGTHALTVAIRLCVDNSDPDYYTLARLSKGRYICISAQALSRAENLNRGKWAATLETQAGESYIVFTATRKADR